MLYINRNKLGAECVLFVLLAVTVLFSSSAFSQVLDDYDYPYLNDFESVTSVHDDVADSDSGNDVNGQADWIPQGDWGMVADHNQWDSYSGTMHLDNNPGEAEQSDISDHLVEMNGYIEIPNTSIVPVLSYYYKLDLKSGGDRVFVEAQVQGGTEWVTLAQYTPENDSSSYTQHTISLDAYKGQFIRIRFRQGYDWVGGSRLFVVDDFYIGDLRADDYDFPYFNDFESIASQHDPIADSDPSNDMNGQADWNLQGDWGMSGAHNQWDSYSGSVHLDNNPAEESQANHSTRHLAEMKGFVEIPDTSAIPVLSYQYKLDFVSSSDRVFVEVQVKGTDAWVELDSYASQNEHTAYTRQTHSLSAYKGQSIRIRFRQISDWRSGSRLFVVDDFYIGERQLSDYDFPYFNDFEAIVSQHDSKADSDPDNDTNGQEDWNLQGDWGMSDDHNQWDNYSGSIHLDNNPGEEQQNSKNIGQLAEMQGFVEVPTSSVVPVLSYQYKLNLIDGSDRVFIEVQVEGTEDWAMLAYYAPENNHGSYTRQALSLEDYKGQSIRIRFRQIHSWIGGVRLLVIDDVYIGELRLDDYDFPYFNDFESVSSTHDGVEDSDPANDVNGQADWNLQGDWVVAGDHSQWTSYSGTAHLDNNSTEENQHAHNSGHLAEMKGLVKIPDTSVSPALSYYYKLDLINFADRMYVEIYAQETGSWVNVKTYTPNNDVSGFVQDSISLDSFKGQSIRVRFRQYNAWDDGARVFVVDDLLIEDQESTEPDGDSDGVLDGIDICPATPIGETVDANGCSATQLDTDGDGVNDSTDQCAATPAGETVDANGCSATQLDTDGDGVNDSTDQCAATPAGETVDANGCSATQLDTDGDSVNDATDQCAATPTGETVDANGCSATQLDADGDGVNDSTDQCAATPAGETVDANGCSATQLDADGDGVNDATDQCAATPTGETVDANGCSATQLDADDDGVNDATDQCAATPAAETVDANGCSATQLDADGDGVNDATDQCAATPAGVMVDANGCSATQLDTDGDGVNDATDQCAATPTGETVNANGCSASQLDTDGDGVNDATDQCAATPAGETVDAQGCSDTQKDTDGDGVSDATDQCPDTPTGEGANSDGCSFSQIDTDGDGVLDINDAFPNDPAEWTDFDGDGIGDNSDTDFDGDGVDNTQDPFPNDPAEWADLDGDGIGDNSDDDRDGDGVANADDYFPDDPNAWTVPTVTITSPDTLTTFGVSSIEVTGTIDDPNAILTINGVPISHSGGAYQANVVIEEGHNAIVVRAVDQKGKEGTATISVSLDKTPPYVTIDNLTDGQVVRSDTIAVTGLINDIVRGTVASNQAIVHVNGVPASVANRSYLAENVQLLEGDNIITVAGSDNVGNTAVKEINVIYQPVSGAHIEPVAGQGQSGTIFSTLAQPLQVKLVDGTGNPVADKIVVYRVTQGSGVVAAGTADEGQGTIVRTDAQGIAATHFKLGARAGDGIHRVRAKAVGFDGEVIFHANATPNPGDKISVIAGNNQRGIVRQPLPQPFTVAVVDDGANLIQGAPVEFKVTKGGGKFKNDLQTITATTDTDGRASAQLILGPEAGLDRQRVSATLIGTQAKAGFTASGLMPGDPGNTRVTGVVLDNQDTPIPGVTVRVDGLNRQAVADAQGQFTIDSVPVGPVHLIADGSTATVPGEWPTLSYNIVTVTGADNPLAAPIYMVKLDTENAVFVGEEDVEYTLPEIPGFKLKVKAGSVTFPDGNKTGQISVTAVNANKVPMPPPNGMQPQFIVTIQPAGAMFDPPAPLTIPNTDGHAPGAQVEMYSYDHDLEEFVTIGLGTVSKDGSVIESNSGVGVIKAGWHCGSQPGGSGCASGCDYCEDCDGECNCEVVSDRVKLEQEPDDCRTLLCGGGYLPENGETPITRDQPQDCQKPVCSDGDVTQIEDEFDVPEDVGGDCRMPTCNNGSAEYVDDDTDINQEDAKCKKCDDQDLVVDESKNGIGCGDGSPEQACLVCNQGECERPDCDASSDTLEHSIETDEIATRFFNKINSIASRMPWGSAQVTPSAEGTMTVGEECCADCTQPVSSASYYEGRGTLKAALKVEIGKRASITYDWESPVVAGYQVDFSVDGKAAAAIGLNSQLTGAVRGRYNPTCGEGCIGVSASASLTPVAEAGAVLERFWFVARTIDGDEVDIVSVSEAALWASVEIETSSVSINASRGENASCGNECKYVFGAGKLVAVVSGGSVTILNVEMFSLPSYEYESPLWAGTEGSCGV